MKRMNEIKHKEGDILVYNDGLEKFEGVVEDGDIYVAGEGVYNITKKWKPTGRNINNGDDIELFFDNRYHNK